MRKKYQVNPKVFEGVFRKMAKKTSRWTWKKKPQTFKSILGFSQGSDELKR